MPHASGNSSRFTEKIEVLLNGKGPPAAHWRLLHPLPKTPDSTASCTAHVARIAAAPRYDDATISADESGSSPATPSAGARPPPAPTLASACVRAGDPSSRVAAMSGSAGAAAETRTAADAAAPAARQGAERGPGAA
jgi:hypothetical protein